MKRRIKPLLLSCIFALFACTFVSCLNNDENDYRFYTSQGTIEGNHEIFRIITDGGNRLNVIENEDPHFKVEDGKRVVANYNIEAEHAEGYDVTVVALSNLLTKKPVYISQLTPAQIDSLGYDPINIRRAWFGAQKYLNLDFEIYYFNTTMPHFINLVVDEVASTDDHVHVILKHNAFSDGVNYYGFGRVSFDLTGLVPAGKDQVKVTLTWNSYDGETNSDTGVFYLGGAEEASFIGSPDTQSMTGAILVQ